VLEHVGLVVDHDPLEARARLRVGALHRHARRRARDQLVDRSRDRPAGRGVEHGVSLAEIANPFATFSAIAAPSDFDPEADLALALALADAADRLTLPRFRAQDLVVETKPDLSPVTEADRAVETMIRTELERARPADAVLGEEQGETRVGASRRWIVDPIDGTKGYARGLPVWATLLALEVDGELVLGVVSAPALGTRWWARRGGGTWRNGELVRVSQVARVEDAQMAYSSVTAFDDDGRGDGFRALARRCWRTRGLGDFWSHVLVADGSVDISVEVGGLNLWDVAPLLPIVEEAGGRITDLTGVVRADGGNVLATNRLLHDEALGLLR
jgi:histidinol-phosphatase